MNNTIKILLLFLSLFSLISISFAIENENVETHKLEQGLEKEINMCKGVNMINCLFNQFLLQKCYWDGECKRILI